jgi:competence protein ComEC
MPVALAMTAGIVLDRFWIVPLPASLCAAFVCLLAWLIFSNSAHKWLALVYLWGGVAGFGAAYHHWQRYYLEPSDISYLASDDPLPIRVRGTLQTAPLTQDAPDDPLRSMPGRQTTRFVLRVFERQELATRSWSPVTGQVQVMLIGRTGDITVGDEVELLGRIARPGEAMNPGEFDYASFLRDQGISALLTVKDEDEVTLVRRGWPTSLFGWLAVIRGWGQRTLGRDLGSQSGVAAALLLGEGSGMTGDDWEQYLRTGVIHVLAISGQHLVVLAGFLWLAVRIVGVRRRHAALFVAVLLIGYALLTGGRPPVMRSAWVIAAYCGGILLMRPVFHANTFALGWIGVAIMNPTDIFNAGCQLSFLAVAVLVWGVGQLKSEPVDPLQRVIDASRPWYVMALIWTARYALHFYIINAVVWLAVSPLVAANFHVVSPIALVLGPPMVLLTSIALLAGFAFLLFAGWCWPLAWLFGSITQGSLFGCEVLVSLGQRLPGAYFFVADVPTWWLWVFYVGLLIGMTSPLAWQYGRWALSIGGVWLLLGVLMQVMPHRPGELRCTFVAVGHGGCTVLELPDGHVAVYDAGTMGSSDVTRRHIAPFLWSRGICRIDELILSHADLDHFNGVPQLAERFAIGRVLCTPTFAERSHEAVALTVSALERRAIPMEIVYAGQCWQTQGVTFEVLHPPPVGPSGKENARSLVLLVKYAGWSMLLTGDLEEAGLTRVLAMPAPHIDVLMAPHHGSDKSNIPALAAWAKPKIAVSCQTASLNPRRSVKMYESLGIRFLGTWPHGMVTIHHDGRDAWVETYRTQQLLRPF